MLAVQPMSTTQPTEAPTPPTPKVFDFSINTPDGMQSFELQAGTSIMFVGANGSGKTRLAVQIENDLGASAHRIAAHRALILNTLVPKVSTIEAENGLFYGNAASNASLAHRQGNRWGNKASTMMLNDFDRLVQALFANQANIALQSHDKLHAGDYNSPETTNLQKLQKIFERLLPHRKLRLTGDDILVLPNDASEPYRAEEMSDGERAIFYLIGQTLTVPPDRVLIFDEPELHIHRSIMGRLWDELEAARPDCGFIFISHDLEFVASRIAAKYIIRDYNHPTASWVIQEVPEDTGFSEEVATLILGSRRPILFTEGDRSSLEYAICRNAYPDWTVIPRGSCEEVIYAVSTMHKNTELTRVKCSGMVDADDRSQQEIDYLKTLLVTVLPVCEIENIFALPQIATAILKHEGHPDNIVAEKLAAFNQAIISQVQSGANLENCVARYCQRRIDRALKSIDLSDARTIPEIKAKYESETKALDIELIANERRQALNKCITDNNITGLMALYDDKGIIAIAAQHLKATKAREFQAWLTRILSNNNIAPNVIKTIHDALPQPLTAA